MRMSQLERRMWLIVAAVLTMLLLWRASLLFMQTKHSPQLPEIVLPPRTKKFFRRQDASSMPSPRIGVVDPSSYHRLRYHENVDRSNTVFVMMVSPGPDRCIAVVSNIFTTAARPKDIFVGVVETTNNVEVSHCVNPEYALLNRSQFSPSDNIRTRRLLPQEGKGYSWKMFIASMMFRNEHYILMMAPFVMLQPTWDSLLIARHKSMVSERVVLTSRPQADASRVSLLCKLQFTEELPSVEAVDLTGEGQLLASTDFLFGRGAVTEDAPLDPALLDLSTGMDFLYSARLWTSGYSFVPIPPQVATANEKRSATSDSSSSRKRALDLLMGVKEDPTYGLGAQRPIGQFMQRVGADMDHRTQKAVTCE